MSRIAQAFQRTKSKHRAAFVAYLCAGDPDFETCLDACRTLLDSGVDLLELGVPFSDPLADGLTNQLAAQRALASGMTAARVFELVRRIREFSEVPIVFYTYYNLVFSNGIDAYVSAAKKAGVDGLLTLDLPPEEADENADREHQSRPGEQLKDGCNHQENSKRRSDGRGNASCGTHIALPMPESRSKHPPSKTLKLSWESTGRKVISSSFES